MNKVVAAVAYVFILGMAVFILWVGVTDSDKLALVLGSVFLAVGIILPVDDIIRSRREKKEEQIERNKIEQQRLKEEREEQARKEREKAEEQRRQEAIRAQKEDFLRNPIIIDTETTGTTGKDEILQLAIIDKDGKVLFNELFRPVGRKTWPNAEAVNHISPEMVKDKRPIDEHYDNIQDIIDGCTGIIGYNTAFDLNMLRNAGLDWGGPTADVMLDFAAVAGDWDEKHGDYQWKKLIQCARYYDYKWPGPAHDALSDAQATLFCFQEMTSDGSKWELRRQ